MPITSSEFSALTRRMRESAEMAKYCVSDEEMLVACIHPSVEEFIRNEAAMSDRFELRGVAGIGKVMVTDSVPGFCILICNENL